MPEDPNLSVRQNEEQATAERAGLLNLSYIDSRDWSARAPLIKNTIDTQQMYALHAVPIALDNGRMEFAITSATPQGSTSTLRARYPDFNLTFRLISESGYKELMRRHDPPKEVEYQDISINQAGASETLAEVSSTLETVRSDDMLNYLITQAEKLGASDIHFENGKDNVRMRFRVDGALHSIAELSREKFKQLTSSIAVRADISTNAKEAQTGRLSQEFKLPNGEIKVLNMRIETVPAAHGQDAVIRLFNLDRKLMKLDSLGLSANQTAELQDIIRHPHGLVMVVGPTGSGKTTTLYSILEQLNTSDKKIITLEDPVEYNFDGITQIPISTHQGDESFASNLRAVLRMDPDVIMIGEIRDLDTAKTALQAALTGHLVLSTFHASNAAAALTRMLDVIGENPLFSSAIRLVLAQRLVRRLDDATKVSYQPDEQLKAELQAEVDTLPEGVDRPNLDSAQLFKPTSSPSSPFGYSGRLMIAEQIRMSPEIRKLLRQGAKSISAEDIERIAIDEGMITMLQDGVLKALSGITSIEEIYRAV